MKWFWDKKDDLALARFVVDSQDSEAVKAFIEEAVKSSDLPKSEYDFHERQNDGRRQLIEKIYQALVKKQVEYALNEYDQSSGNRQQIRTPKEILETQRKGTCLDLAILFCAICRYYDFLPILILVDGHALAAVSLTHGFRDWKKEERREQERFWEGLGKLTDANKLQKMVKRGDYLAIECTGFAKSETLGDEQFPRNNGFWSFDQAVELGGKQLEKSLKFALDIAIAYNFWLPNVCRKRLEAETPKRLINSPTNGENPLRKLHVPLGLIERKPNAQRRPKENSARPEELDFNKPDPQYEVVREYKHKEFLNEVLKHNSSTRSKGKRLAIAGDPGAGKTTLLQMIAYWILKEEQGLPIWISLANVNEEWVKPRGETDEGWLYRYLSQNWLRNAAGEPQKTPVKWQQAFEEILKSGQVWLLLDGADEMAVKNPLTELKKQLAKGWADSVRVVLSCRLNLWEAEKDALSETFDIYRTLEFHYPEQVNQFISNWFEKDNPEAKKLQEQLAEEKQKRLQDLVKNPLRLALLCSIWNKGQSALPETKAGFYQLLVESHYTWKDHSTNEEFDIPTDSKKELNRALGELAREAIDSKDFRFRLRESFIKEFLEDPNEKDSLFWWALKLGWLIHVGLPTEEETNRHENLYAFVHPTFQEYFAATGIENYDFFLPKEHQDRPKNKRYRIFEPQWKEVILLWLGHSEGGKQKEEFIQALVKFNDECEKFYWYRAYFLAAAGIAEFRDCNCADEIVKQLVKWRCGNFNTKIRQAAEEALRETQRERAINSLIELLKSAQNEDTRLQAAESLGEIGSGNQNALNSLIELLKSAQDEETRWLAAYSLGKIDPGNQNALNSLIELLKSAQDEETRWLAAYSLEKIDPGNQNAINCLIELLKSAQDEKTRGLAAYSLGEIDPGNQNAINGLIELLKSAQDEKTRGQAASSLGKIGSGNQNAINGLIELLKSAQDEDTLWEATFSLEKIDPGNQNAIKYFILSRFAQDEVTRRQAAESLGKIGSGNQYAINCLIELLKSAQDKVTRLVAAYSLEKIGSGNQYAINCLIELLKSAQDEKTRRQAAESLGNIGSGNQYAINCLIELLKSAQDKDTREQAASSLEKIGSGNQNAINSLIELLKSAQDKDTRLLAAESLTQITQDKGLNLAVSGLKSGLTYWVQIMGIINTSDRYEHCYKLIWNCAQNMTYPDFYKAWHTQPKHLSFFPWF